MDLALNNLQRLICNKTSHLIFLLNINHLFANSDVPLFNKLFNSTLFIHAHGEMVPSIAA